MCLAIPARVILISPAATATVEISGVQKQISLALVDDVSIGDYVIMHMGYALKKMNVDEAEATLALISEALSYLDPKPTEKSP